MEKKKKNYKARFFKNPLENARRGKLTYVRKEYHERICRMLLFINGNNTSIYGFIDNVLEEHLHLYRDEINALYHQRRSNLI